MIIGDVKHIVIIESLVNEKLTGKELYNDHIRRQIDLYEKPITHKYHSINSKNNLIVLLKDYQEKANDMNGGVLFHFDMHGHNELEGLILSDDSLVKWKELADLLRHINIVTSNKLFITMGTCYGRYLYKGIDLNQKIPFYGYISASNEVNPMEIVNKFSVLFEQLIEKGNIVEAYLVMEKSKSSFYYKDSFKFCSDSFKVTIESLFSEKEKKDLIEQEKNENDIEENKIVSEMMLKLATKAGLKKLEYMFDFTSNTK